MDQRQHIVAFKLIPAMKEVQLNQESDTDYFTAQPFDQVDGRPS